MWSDGPVRWWRAVPGGVLALTSIGILIGRWSAIVGSHPAYLVLLVVVAIVGIALVATSVVRQRAGGGAPDGDESEPAERRPPHRGRTIAVRAVGILATIAVVGVLLYLRPLAATGEARDLLDDPPAGVEVDATWNQIELAPTDVEATTGVVFFPGALVEPSAYVPNLVPLAEAGYLVVIVKAPFNLAIAAGGRFDDVVADHPSVEHWVVAGHSLGGVVASSVARSDEDVDGLLLWASYPNGSLAERDGLEVTSISGSEDGLSTPDEIDASAADLPPGTEFVEVDGANHAQFGSYGDQSGDGEATIDDEQASEAIVAASLGLLERVDAQG